MSVELNLLSTVALGGREIAGPRRRALLALLAADPGAGMGSAKLIAELWPEDPPENPAKALQVLVSRTRAETTAGLIASTPGGYRLTLPPDRIDAWALEERAAAAERHAAAGDHAAALERAESALALWNGSVEPGEGPVVALRLARCPAVVKARKIRALSLARLGRLSEAAALLGRLWADRPGDEEVLAELLRAEAATSGLEAALARYDAHRRDLRERLGTDPGAALRETHRRLLRAGEPAVRHGVPHETSPLLGREKDVTAVLAMLRSSRVVTIAGPGGLGKSRVAQAVARSAEEPEVRLVALAGVEDGAQVAAEIGAAFDAEDPPGALIPGIAQAIGSRRVLLVLDDCERVVDGVAEAVGALVRLTPELRVLVTSRAPLGLSAESVHALPELAVEPAVELFTRRARAARPGAELRYEEVADLCARLEGLPLAIELAAARVRVMSVAEISRRLEDRFALLRGASRDAPARHRTMRAVVDWSWRLLDEQGRAAVRLLSVFPGGFTAESAGRVLGADPDETLDVLDRLAAQSLLSVTETATCARFRMPAAVRDFGLTERAGAGEDERAVTGFLGWAREFGLAHNELAFIAPGEVGPVRVEQDNLVRALRYALDAGDGPTVAGVFAALGPRWFVSACHARIADLAPEIVSALSHLRPEPSLVDAIRTSAVVCALSRFTRGGSELRSTLVLRRLPEAPPDTPVRAIALAVRALSGGPATIEELLTDPRPLAAGVAHAVRSFRREQDGDIEGALAEAALMLTAFERSGNPWLRYHAHCCIGRLALLAEQGERAGSHLETALRHIELLESAPDREDLRTALIMAELQCGDVEGALNRLGPDHDGPFGHPYKLVTSAEISLAQGDVDSGLRRWRDLLALIDAEPHPPHRPDPRGVQVWTLEIRSAAVLAHAYHRRLDLVAGPLAELPRQVAALLRDPASGPAGHLAEMSACGAVLLALAIADLTAGRTVPGARLIALAERFNPPRQIHPSMSGPRARRAAEQAAPEAYRAAVAEFASLDVPGLRAAALAALRDRPGL